MIAAPHLQEVQAMCSRVAREYLPELAATGVSDVTVACGVPLAQRATIEMRVGDSVARYAVADFWTEGLFRDVMGYLVRSRLAEHAAQVTA